MVTVYKAPLSADEIKAKARALGADLVGIADGRVMDEFPPDPHDPRRPSDITEHDGERVIVLGKKFTSGTSRILPWNDRHKYYNDELTVPIRLSPIPTTSRVLPIPRVKLALGRAAISPAMSSAS